MRFSWEAFGQPPSGYRLIGTLDPDEWDLPPKPKWMRWQTYENYIERYDAYEVILGSGVAELLAKFLDE
jgi:myo-inositol catabolism protein IolC